MYEMDLNGDMPLVVNVTALVNPDCEGQTQFFLDVCTLDANLRFIFADVEPLLLLRRAVTALLRDARRPVRVPFANSHAFTQQIVNRPYRQARLDLFHLDSLP